MAGQSLAQFRIPIRSRFVSIAAAIDTQQLARPNAPSPQTVHRRTSHRFSCLQAPTVFTDHGFQHFLIQAEIGDPGASVAGFFLEALEPLGLAHVHGTGPRFPGVDGRIADSSRVPDPAPCGLAHAVSARRLSVPL
jgi:hypothetical protein